MKGLLLAVAIVLGMASSAFAHGGARVAFVPDGFGGVRAVIVQDHFVPRSFHAPRGFVPRGHVNQFNQNGGRNRIGFRR